MRIILPFHRAGALFGNTTLKKRIVDPRVSYLSIDSGIHSQVPLNNYPLRNELFRRKHYLQISATSSSPEFRPLEYNLISCHNTDTENSVYITFPSLQVLRFIELLSTDVLFYGLYFTEFRFLLFRFIVFIPHARKIAMAQGGEIQILGNKTNKMIPTICTQFTY